jgi:hypothetical protein
MQPLHLLRRGRAACHHADGRCALSAFNAPCPSAGRRCQGHPADGAPDQSTGEQCARAERRTVLIFPSTRNFPRTPKIRRSRASGHKKIAPVANICGSKRYILYVSGPTCRGPVPLCMPPSTIKGEACDVTYRLRILDPTLDSQAHTSSQAIHHTVE